MRRRGGATAGEMESCLRWRGKKASKGEALHSKQRQMGPSDCINGLETPNLDVLVPRRARLAARQERQAEMRIREGWLAAYCSYDIIASIA